MSGLWFEAALLPEGWTAQVRINAVAGRIEAIAGVNLPMLVRAFTYRDKGMETMIKKAISGGCDGVLHIDVDPIYASARS